MICFNPSGANWLHFGVTELFYWCSGVKSSNFSAKKVKEQRLLAEKRKADEEAKRLKDLEAKEAEKRRLAEESAKAAQYEMSPQGIFQVKFLYNLYL